MISDINMMFPQCASDPPCGLSADMRPLMHCDESQGGCWYSYEGSTQLCPCRHRNRASYGVWQELCPTA